MASASFARLFVLLLGPQPRVNGDERGRQHPFAEQVLKKIRNAKSGAKGVGGIRVAKKMGKNAVANQAGDAEAWCSSTIEAHESAAKLEGQSSLRFCTGFSSALLRHATSCNVLYRCGHSENEP